MDLKLIEKLMAAMNRNGMRRLSLKEEGIEIELEKEEAYSSPRPMKEQVFAPFPQVYERTEEKPSEQRPKGEDRFITSPMVGTFYAGASPKDPPYVKAGDVVEEESPVCIIEAMKVMNEVKAGLKGTVAEVLVKNGDPVEFGTKLFRIV